MSEEHSLKTVQTLSFEPFWSWLTAHPNCILRAGSSDAFLYDDDDLHWHFATEGEEHLLVQVIRGKHLLGELLLRPSTVSYVQAGPGEQQDEFIFELIADDGAEQRAIYFFVMAHGYDDAPAFTPARVH